jgi:hypothetical protein
VPSGAALEAHALDYGEHCVFAESVARHIIGESVRGIADRAADISGDLTRRVETGECRVRERDRCGFPVFDRLGIVHSFAARSTSACLALRTSCVRTQLRIRNSRLDPGTFGLARLGFLPEAPGCFQARTRKINLAEIV